jgi:hypothetical protein
VKLCVSTQRWSIRVCLVNAARGGTKEVSPLTGVARSSPETPHIPKDPNARAPAGVPPLSGPVVVTDRRARIMDRLNAIAQRPTPDNDGASGSS